MGLFKALFSPIYSFFNFSSPTSFTLQYAEKIEPPAGFDVSSWCYFYQQDALGGDVHRERLIHFVVKELLHFKDMTASPAHEFVVAVVEVDSSLTGDSRGNPMTLYYRLERFRPTSPGKQSTLDSLKLPGPDEAFSQEIIASVRSELKGVDLEGEDEGSSSDIPVDPLKIPIATPFGSASTAATISTYSAQTIAFSKDRINLKTDADDRVWKVDKLPKAEKQKLVLLDRVSPGDMTLSDLVILASSVHEKDHLYSLFRNQSFWFANIIMRVAEGNTREGGAQTQMQEEDKVLVNLKKPGGTWRNITIHQTTQAVVKAIAELYQINRKKFQDELKRAAEEDQRPNRNLEEAKRRAEAAEQEVELLKQKVAAMESSSTQN